MEVKSAKLWRQIEKRRNAKNFAKIKCSLFIGLLIIKESVLSVISFAIKPEQIKMASIPGAMPQIQVNANMQKNPRRYSVLMLAVIFKNIFDSSARLTKNRIGIRTRTM